MKPRHSRQRRAVITGIGPVTAVGIGKEALWDAVIKGRSGVGRVSFFDTSALHAHHAAEIPDWDPAVFFSPQRLKRLDRYAQFAVASALLALEDARLPWSRETPQDRVGVSFGTALGGIAHAEREHTAFVSGGPKAVSQTLALTVFGGSAHANIAIECGFRGPGTTNSNSCASGAVSVGEALRYIRDDMADVIVAGAAEASICPLTYGAFDFIKTMSRWNGEPAAHAYQPFDLHRQGFVMGEGAASLVIEEYEHALRRGAFIYAEVLGYGLSNEAYHMTSPLPGGASVIRCMRDTLADAGLQPDAIDYINAHASGTQMNDSNEVACIQTVFGATPPPVSGTKAITGHPLGATAAIESVLCALAIERQVLPPTLHLCTPDPLCSIDVVPNAARPAMIRHALNNAFGFGGINACVAFGAVESH
ncbi:MAG: beta-ketoacyl-[acyl-carrier-protein] synthase family protein [Verrucomicrobia bacterium]|nr:beta-ketoacyl-[acyl-carrier-protein] synthase family protein [Verrucomicrobiota bacterium]